MIDSDHGDNPADEDSMSADASDEAADGYAVFQPMTQAAASTANDRSEPTRLLLIGLILFALASAGVLMLNGYSIYAVLYNGVYAIPPALIAIFVTARKSLGWRAKYLLVTRIALFVLSLALLSPIMFSSNSLIKGAAICGGGLLVAFAIESFYQKRKQ